MGSTFASILDIYKGVPDGFIIGQILFSVFLNQLMCFIKLTEVRNFADNIKLYSCSAINNDANQKPTNHIHFVLNCFRVNSTVANPGISDKLIILLASSWWRINVKLLGITIDDKLSFNKYIDNLCNIGNNRLRVFTRKRKSLPTEQTIRLLEAYGMSGIKYCLLIWMFCSKTASNLVSNIRKRTF